VGVGEEQVDDEVVIPVRDLGVGAAGGLLDGAVEEALDGGADGVGGPARVADLLPAAADPLNGEDEADEEPRTGLEAPEGGFEVLEGGVDGADLVQG
jgi:hypothetical protein